MNIEIISDKVVKLTPEQGKIIAEILTGRTHKVVHCSPKAVSHFKAIAA